MILFVNACVRKESRTLGLAETLLSRLAETHPEWGTVDRLDLDANGPMPLSGATLAERDAVRERGDLDDPMLAYARELARADAVVIAAPYWDLSFPALLKSYLEAVNVGGITFDYDETGVPVGLCKAEVLYYVTTAGGRIFDDAFGYGYVETLAKSFWGISETKCFKAEMLDVAGSDVEGILEKAREEIETA